jgi:hypothetical protein
MLDTQRGVGRCNKRRGGGERKWGRNEVSDLVVLRQLVLKTLSDGSPTCMREERGSVCVTCGDRGGRRGKKKKKRRNGGGDKGRLRSERGQLERTDQPPVLVDPPRQRDLLSKFSRRGRVEQNACQIRLDRHDSSTFGCLRARVASAVYTGCESR